jgi:hypothetical protein
VHRTTVSAAGVVIDEDGRTLVIQQRDNGHWASRRHDVGPSIRDHDGVQLITSTG